MPLEQLQTEDLLPNKFQALTGHIWKLEIPGIDNFIVKSFSRPTMTHGSTTRPYGNATIKTMGRPEWGNIDLVVYDPIAPSGAQQIMAWQRLHYESVSGRAGYADFYKKDIVLKMADPVGNVVQRWVYVGAFLESVNYNAVSRESAEPLEINMTVAFDNCVLSY